VELHLHSPNTPSWRGAQLKHRNNFYIFLPQCPDQKLRPTQLSVQRVPGVLSLGIKRPGREADHSSPSSAEFRELVEPYLHSITFHGVVLS